MRRFGSLSFRLDSDDLIKIAKGAGIAVLGALVPTLAALAGAIDESTVLGSWLAAAAAVGVNALRKWLADNSGF